MDALRHAIPIFEFAAAGRGQGKHQGTNCFHSAFLLVTHNICHDSPAQCQGFFIFKVESKCPVWQKVASNLVRSSVVVVVCDCRTVSDCTLDYSPLFSEKMLESWPIFPKVSCRHYSKLCRKALGHLCAQPICALEDALSFSPLLWKKLFSLFYTKIVWIMFRVSNDTCSKRLQQWLR